MKATYFNMYVGVNVTILILIDGFLQWKVKANPVILPNSHNPYFNRWFSAICLITICLRL